jgi:hypothetical protein
MIEVTLQEDGTGLIGLPGRSIPLDAANIAAAREQAVRILTEHAAVQPLPLDVYARDNDEVVHFAVHPDGRIIVDRPGAHNAAAEPLGPSMVPAPMAPPESYVPAEFTPPQPAQAAPDSAPEEIMLEQSPVEATIQAQPDLPDDVERTAVRPPAHGYVAILDFAGKTPVTISGSALLGRRPVAEHDEAIDQLDTIDDDTRSDSKTHLLAEWRGGAFWIIDRNSSNGTRLFSDGVSSAARLVPGVAHPVANADLIEIGDVQFTVHLNTPRQK